MLATETIMLERRSRRLIYPESSRVIPETKDLLGIGLKRFGQTKWPSSVSELRQGSPRRACGSWMCKNFSEEALRADAPASKTRSVIFASLMSFWPEVARDAASDQVARFCNSRSSHGCDDFALIAAMSGRMRVRLQASTCSAIPEATIGRWRATMEYYVGLDVSSK